MMQYFEGTEQDAIDRRLALAGPYGDAIGREAARAKATLARRGLEELASFRRDDLDAGRRVSAAVIERRLRDVIANAAYAANRPIFNQFNGLHVTLATFLTTLQPLRNRRDVENYLERLAQVAECLGAASPKPRPRRSLRASSSNERSRRSRRWRRALLASMRS